jgi:CRP/FNR family cyclic AMP-dependent transcriptional regulator
MAGDRKNAEVEIGSCHIPLWRVTDFTMPMSGDALLSAAGWVLEPLGTIDLKSGETLFRQGDACTVVYLLLSGEVQIQIESSDQPPHTLAMLGPGAILGEMGPLTHEPRSATCVALTDTRLAELPYSTLNAGLERGDRWATQFLISTARVLAQRLAALNKEAISVMAQVEKSKSKVPAEDELERLRRRLLREWTF